MRFKLSDKRGPLVDLGKHLGLFGKANGNGAHPSPTVNVNVFVTSDESRAQLEEVFDFAAAGEATDDPPTKH